MATVEVRMAGSCIRAHMAAAVFLTSIGYECEMKHVH